MLCRCCLCVLLASSFVQVQAEEPPAAATLPQPRSHLPGPEEQPERWLLAFIDVETTGLVPGWHEMIDIGVVMTDLAGNELGKHFQRIQPRHPERLDEGARAVNAFDPDRWAAVGAVDARTAVEGLRSFHRELAGDRSVLFVAYNSQFDAAFLDHLFRTADGSWRELYHYFVLDVPSMAWSLGLRGLTGQALAEALGVQDEPRIAQDHTGLTGAQLNARLYRAIEARRSAMAR